MAKVRRPVDAGRAGLSPELKTIALIAAVAVVGFAIYWTTRGGEEAAEAAADDSKGYVLPVPGVGPVDAPVVLTKFTDFQ